jgi:hypothetical protein
MMHVQLLNGSIFTIKEIIQIDEFPIFLSIGMGTDNRLQDTEALARNLIDSNFNQDLVATFVHAVCLWGGDLRRYGRIIPGADINGITQIFQNSYINSIEGRTSDAIAEITQIRGLSVSFGSKHLKFLDPLNNVVLDSVISENLGYARNISGYILWLATCREILEIVRERGVDYPGIGENGWRVSDVEMAIFNKIQRG